MDTALPRTTSAVPFGEHDDSPHAALADSLAAGFALDAAERDRQGGVALAERNALRASGLLRLSVPRELGGPGASWPEILRIVRRFSEADSAVAHLFAFHHLQVASVLLWGSEDQARRLLGPVVSGQAFWGNAANGLDAHVRLIPDGSRYVLDGTKTFCSGASDSDTLLVTALRSPAAAERVAIVIPTRREGVKVLGDWDAFGQRQTDSGTVVFSRVAVKRDEVLLPGPQTSPRATLRTCLAQLILAEIYLGNARGALRSAWHYVHDEGRPNVAAGVDRILDDPYIARHFGDFRLAIRGATLLADSAHARLQAAWARGTALTAEERGRVAIEVSEARLASARAGLEVTSRIFETLGARSTATRHGLDRYWRNVRTHTLHDSLDYKLRDLGRWVLTGAAPEPGLYS